MQKTTAKQNTCAETQGETAKQMKKTTTTKQKTRTQTQKENMKQFKQIQQATIKHAHKHRNKP